MARRALLPQAERDLGVTSFWVANLGYARLKPSTLFGSKRVAVVLHVEEDEGAEGHVLMDLAAAAQAALRGGHGAAVGPLRRRGLET